MNFQMASEMNPSIYPSCNTYHACKHNMLLGCAASEIIVGPMARYFIKMVTKIQNIYHMEMYFKISSDPGMGNDLYLLEIR